MKSALFLVVALAATLPAQADESFRCGKWVVSSAMPLSELTSKCGQPSAQSSSTQDVRVRNRNTGLMEKVGETTTEIWTYDRGTQAAPMVVTLIDGKIKSIDRKR